MTKKFKTPSLNLLVTVKLSSVYAQYLNVDNRRLDSTFLTIIGIKRSMESLKDTKKDADISDNISDELKIFTTTDDKLKIIGEILSNESSRKIYSLLIQNELPTLQICKETGLQLSLVLHHLNKMISVELVTISKTEKSDKNQDMKFYKAKSAIMVLPHNAFVVAKKSKMFSNSINKILKFVAIGVVGISSWIFTEIMLKPPITLDRPSGNPMQAYQYIAIIIGLVVIVVGLIAERFLVKKSH